MIGALLLFMMMAANFQNALNDYGIRSNAFMNGVIASGSNGSGSDGWFDNWNAEYPTCTYDYYDYFVLVAGSSDPVPEGYYAYKVDGTTIIFRKLMSEDGTERVCTPGAGLCLWGSECCLNRNSLGLCSD